MAGFPRRPGQGPAPSLEHVLKWIRRKGAGKIAGILVGVIALIWLLTGIYTVGPGELGVVRQFGKEVGQTGPGLHYHLPGPI
ncbi:MAG: hypothetical protein ACOC6S_03005 [Chloroflexota bacterium]